MGAFEHIFVSQIRIETHKQVLTDEELLATLTADCQSYEI